MPPARPLGQTLRPGLMGLLSLVILLLLWQGIAPRYPNVILPPPADVALALARLFGEGQIWPAVGSNSPARPGGIFPGLFWWAVCWGCWPGRNPYCKRP